MKVKSLLHYDIIMEKYDKLVKIRKLAKYGKIGPSSLKKMPTTIYGLRKMPTPLYHTIACLRGYISIVLVLQEGGG